MHNTLVQLWRDQYTPDTIHNIETEEEWGDIDIPEDPTQFAFALFSL